MSSFTNTFENDVLLLLFNNTNIGDLGDVTGVQGSSAPGSLYIALLTADPTDAGTQTNEATFGAYARVAVARSGAGWTVAGNSVSNTSAITFAECTSGSETITHFAIADSLTTGTYLAHAPVDTPRAVATGVTLEFGASALTCTLD
jgi:hypothetical protein